MNLRPLGVNQTEVIVNDDLHILFSYKTPVATYQRKLTGGMTYFVTNKKWSKTTTRHISKWIGTNLPVLKPQEWFDSLLDKVQYQSLNEVK